MANHFAVAQSPGSEDYEASLDMAYLAANGMDKQIERWWDLCFSQDE